MVANCVYLNLKVSNVTLKQWGYFGQFYILRFKNETNDIYFLPYNLLKKKLANECKYLMIINKFDS